MDRISGGSPIYYHPVDEVTGGLRRLRLSQEADTVGRVQSEKRLKSQEKWYDIPVAYLIQEALKDYKRDDIITPVAALDLVKAEEFVSSLKDIWCYQTGLMSYLIQLAATNPYEALERSSELNPSLQDQVQLEAIKSIAKFNVEDALLKTANLNKTYYSKVQSLTTIGSIVFPKDPDRARIIFNDALDLAKDEDFYLQLIVDATASLDHEFALRAVTHMRQEANRDQGYARIAEARVPINPLEALEITRKIRGTITKIEMLAFIVTVNKTSAETIIDGAFELACPIQDEREREDAFLTIIPVLALIKPKEAIRLVEWHNKSLDFYYWKICEAIAPSDLNGAIALLNKITEDRYYNEAIKCIVKETSDLNIAKTFIAKVKNDQNYKDWLYKCLVESADYQDSKEIIPLINCPFVKAIAMIQTIFKKDFDRSKTMEVVMDAAYLINLRRDEYIRGTTFIHILEFIKTEISK